MYIVIVENETDESVKKPEKDDTVGSGGQLVKCKGTLQKILSNKSVSQGKKTCEQLLEAAVYLHLCYRNSKDEAT